ncbi:MAG: peptide ABC transporter substrate-binding protein [Anaerolineales bacterium]
MRYKNLMMVLMLIGLVACNQGNAYTGNLPQKPTGEVMVVSPSSTTSSSPIITSTPTLTPARLLTVCLVHEPRSLFLYNAVSKSEQSVLAAIYDGPIDVKDFTAKPVILQNMPSLANGTAVLQSVQVNAGDLIVDAQGNVANLEQGTSYRPSGCSELACTQVYSGTVPIQMDQLVLDFKLLPDLQWSDGTPLTAADSVYSYEIAHSLYPSALPDLVSRTTSYKSLDDLTVEWVGLPGYMDGLYQTKFFSPLPQHAWASIPVSDLSSDEISSRKPIGWGAYVIDEWVTGDHISLHENPLYFRAAEGLPHFNNLVYRFVADDSEGLSAVLAGECDLVEQSAGFEIQTDSLFQLENEGRISLEFQPAFAWDLIEFNITPLSADRPSFFASKEVRQAVAMCIDRQSLVNHLSAGHMQVADLYVPSEHPYYNPEAVHYSFDPQAASDLLSASGWLDVDNDSSTPRVSQGVEAIADGTAFSVQFLTSDDAEHQMAAQMIQSDLSQCGIQLNIEALPAQQFLASGPDGPVFGRQFDLAQYAWMTSIEPPCSLFLNNEIPGPYPDYPKGWGGVNASGYRNPQYDQSCLDALYSLPDMPQHVQEHAEAQAIFAEDLPALPLYWHYRVTVGRPDLCGIPQQTVTESIFSDLELFNYGEGCP